MNQPPAGSRRPSSATIISGLLILAVIVITVVGALTALQPPDSVTELGNDVWMLYQATLVVSLIVYVLVTSAIIWAVFHFKRRGPAIPDQVHGSTVLEMTWTVVPVLILVALFVPSFILLRD